MADLFAPVQTGTFTDQLGWETAGFAIPAERDNIIDRISLEKRPAYVIKHTGFTATKRKIAPADTFTPEEAPSRGTISISFVRDLPREMLQALFNLANAMNGAGVVIRFNDGLMSGRSYLGRWINAGDFVETSTILSTGNMVIEFYQEGNIVSG